MFSMVSRNLAPRFSSFVFVAGFFAILASIVLAKGTFAQDSAPSHAGAATSLCALLEEGRKRPDRDVAILVDGGAEHGAAMLPVPPWIVRAAAEKR